MQAIEAIETTRVVSNSRRKSPTNDRHQQGHHGDGRSGSRGHALAALTSQEYGVVVSRNSGQGHEHGDEWARCSTRSAITTGITPLSRSATSTAVPSLTPSTRNALVVPAFPLPCFLRSTPLNALPRKTLGDSEPIRYPRTTSPKAVSQESSRAASRVPLLLALEVDHQRYPPQPVLFTQAVLQVVGVRLVSPGSRVHHDLEARWGLSRTAPCRMS